MNSLTFGVANAATVAEAKTSSSVKNVRDEHGIKVKPQKKKKKNIRSPSRIFNENM